MWWKNQIKAVVKRKEDVWKEVLEARDKDARERCLEVYKNEKRMIKRCIYESKEEVREQFGRKMNQGVNRNRKLFWKGLSKPNGGKVITGKVLVDRLVFTFPPCTQRISTRPLDQPKI